MNNTYGAYTSLPIAKGLSVSNMGMCDELHLVGCGCEFDDVCTDDNDKECLMRRKLELSDNSNYTATAQEPSLKVTS